MCVFWKVRPSFIIPESHRTEVRRKGKVHFHCFYTEDNQARGAWRQLKHFSCSVNSRLDVVLCGMFIFKSCPFRYMSKVQPIKGNSTKSFYCMTSNSQMIFAGFRSQRGPFACKECFTNCRLIDSYPSVRYKFMLELNLVGTYQFITWRSEFLVCVYQALKSWMIFSKEATRSE